MTKKLISVIFALIFAISSFSVLSVTASAANNTSDVYPYKSASALSYAAKNWNNGVGLCADFASKCIQAGGINVYSPRCIDLYNALNGTYGTSHKLKLTGGTNGSIRMSDNLGKVDKGDLIFYFCNICKTYTHVVVCNGANEEGYIQDYAHNKAHNGQKRTYTYYHCGYDNWTLYSIDLDEGPVRYGIKTSVETPSITSLNNGANGVVVKWNVVSGADKYNVYRKTATTGWKRVAQTTQNYYTDTKLTNGERYFYTVRAIDNNILSQYYNKDSVVAINAPTLSATNSLGSVTVKWSKVQNADGYYVYRANDKKKWVKIGTVKNGDTLSFTDKNVESGKTYKYTVRAYDNNVAGAYLSKGTSIIYLAAPTSFKAEYTEKGVNITFKAVEGAEKYRVYRKTANAKKWQSLGYTTTNSFVDNENKENVSYVYTARAIKGNTYSNYHKDPITYNVSSDDKKSYNEAVVEKVVSSAAKSASSKVNEK